jgi:adenosylhomocysteine nucleosidase
MATDVTGWSAGVSPAHLPAGETPALQTIAVLFALEREATPFRHLARALPRVRIHVSGVGRARACAAAEKLLRDAPVPSLVIAAGYCGALAPRLKVGDIVTSRILTVDHLVSDPAEKRRLAIEHDADAVDMESGAIEEVCAARRVHFRAVRAVSDTADTALSPELVRLLSGGNVSIWKAMKALARMPGLLSEFRRLARDTKLAARYLADALMVEVTQRQHSPASAARPSPS